MSFVGFWRPPMTPPQTPQYLTILQTERGRALPLVGFWRPPQCPPPPPPTPQYLTILMTERGAPLSCAGLCPPPSPDATILNDLNDSERGWGRQYPVRS